MKVNQIERNGVGQNKQLTELTREISHHIAIERLRLRTWSMLGLGLSHFNMRFHRMWESNEIKKCSVIIPCCPAQVALSQSHCSDVRRAANIRQTEASQNSQGKADTKILKCCWVRKTIKWCGLHHEHCISNKPFKSRVKNKVDHKQIVHT